MFDAPSPDLENVDDHISELTGRIAAQRQVVEGYRSNGWPTDEGERLLGAFLTSLEQVAIQRTDVVGRLP
jgi:hypothetical protein